MGVTGRPVSATDNVQLLTWPWLTSHTDVSPERVISSSPPSPWTIIECWVSSKRKTSAIFWLSSWKATPTSMDCAPAGFVNGPSMLNTVRIPISRRTGPAWRMAGWKAWANMKPMPLSLMHRSTPSGESSILTPSSSSTSALPQVPEAARLPCLATLSPAPAATNAAAVEMLNVFSPSPPVPTESTNIPSTLTRRENSRMTVAMPAISSFVSPLRLRAVKNDPNCAGVASPDIICRMTNAASSIDRESPETTVLTASLISN